MKINQTREFSPVTITLETEAEFANFYALFNCISFRQQCLKGFGNTDNVYNDLEKVRMNNNISIANSRYHDAITQYKGSRVD